MSIEYIEHAAEAIANEVSGLSLSVRRRVAHALDNAGLLGTPDSGAVAETLRAEEGARTVRRAANEIAYAVDWSNAPESVEEWLYEFADRIQFGGEGGTDADT